jgi:NTE family protein
MPYPPRTINLALQGGGSHGAFTWGVLDRLLEDDRLRIEGVSGTSAGAMNAVMLAQGLASGGREDARRALERFWLRVAELSLFSPAHRTWIDRLLGKWNIDGEPAEQWLGAMQHLVSPYALAPLEGNPLRDVLEEVMDLRAVRRSHRTKLFIAATNVETGQPRVFTNEELSADVLLASACLPLAFPAVEIDGAPYWDGGYVGNPTLWPLIYGCTARDILLVQISPMRRPGTPRTAAEIVDRANEISFNAALLAELRAIAFVQRLLSQGQLKESAAKRLKRMHLHRIAAEQELRDLGSASKANVELDFLLYLKELGRSAASAWLAESRNALGVRSSFDAREALLGAASTPSRRPMRRRLAEPAVYGSQP